MLPYTHDLKLCGCITRITLIVHTKCNEADLNKNKNISGDQTI